MGNKGFDACALFNPLLPVGMIFLYYYCIIF